MHGKPTSHKMSARVYWNPLSFNCYFTCYYCGLKDSELHDNLCRRRRHQSVVVLGHQTTGWQHDEAIMGLHMPCRTGAMQHAVDVTPEYPHLTMATFPRAC